MKAIASTALMRRLCTLLLFALASQAAATDLTNQKLFGKWAVSPGGNELGGEVNTAAISPKWIVIGAPRADERGQLTEGAVQVYAASTGAWTRKILPPGAATAAQKFGCAIAISGDLCVIGAYSTTVGANTGQGKVHVYNLATGALVRSLVAPDGAMGDFFGQNLATNGEIIAVSLPNDDSATGSVYLYNFATGAYLNKLQPGDLSSGNFFSYGLAMEGRTLAVGASGNDGGRGAVYFYDVGLTSQLLIKKYQPPGSGVGDGIGYALAMHQGRVVIGNDFTGQVFLYDLANNNTIDLTPGIPAASFGTSVAIHGSIVAVGEHGTSAGRVHLYRSSNGSFIQTLLPPNGDTSMQSFGLSIALQGNMLLATAPEDDTEFANVGTAHLIRPLLQPLPYAKSVTRGDFAPGAADISYGLMNAPVINPDGEVLFTSPLTGIGSNAGKDIGLFSNVGNIASQYLFFKTRTLYAPGANYAVATQLSCNDTGLAIGLSTLSGPNINSLNNQILWQKTTGPGSVAIPLRTGTTILSTTLINTIPKSLSEAVSSNQSGAGKMAVLCNLTSGSAIVVAGDDSAIYYNSLSIGSGALREGTLPAPPIAATVRGQVAPRIAYYYDLMVYSTALTGIGVTAATNTAVFKKSHATAEVLVAQKGSTATNFAGAADADGIAYATFIGESANGNGCAFRATLTDPVLPNSVTSQNNEGIWLHTSSGSTKRAFRRGDSVASLTGVKISRLIQFWAMGSSSVGSSQCLALVQLSGTGVSSANDQALMLFQENDSTVLLLREGDPAPGCPGAKIGVISRVEVDGWDSSYAVIATLTGTTTADNLALFTGKTFGRGDALNQSALRRSFLRLRKGDLYENQPSKIKSFGLPLTSVAASGAGGTGRGRAISYNSNIAFQIDFDNGVRQIVTGSVQ